uniref:Uncharacterized protein n=1 Tax=Vitrella brassicaformis TaxID=1169539 RepID=A0A7S1KAV3_9ALVE
MDAFSIPSLFSVCWTSVSRFERGEEDEMLMATRSTTSPRSCDGPIGVTAVTLIRMREAQYIAAAADDLSAPALSDETGELDSYALREGAVTVEASLMAAKRWQRAEGKGQNGR